MALERNYRFSISVCS